MRRLMAKKLLHLDVQPDFVEKQCAAQPVVALSEFVWNALDAEATKVEVFVTEGSFGTSEIIIRDNGTGMSPEEAEEQFKKLGGSWKRAGMLTKNRKRPVHGREGKGRFKGLALGRVIDWRSVYLDGTLKEFTTTIIKEKINEVEITDIVPAQQKHAGVEVKISELHRDFRSLRSENALQPLTEILALYLKNFADAAVFYNGGLVDPAKAILKTEKQNLIHIVDDGDIYPIQLEIVEWIAPTGKALYLCNEQGFPLTQVEARFHTGTYNFTAYLKSSYLRKLHEEGRLELAELLPKVTEKIDEARSRIKKYFRDKAAESAKTVVEEWKQEKVYPYKGEPTTALQEIERKVFDIVAVNVNDFLPDFSTSPVKQKALHLRLLKHAIEESPEDLQLILQEVLDLPKRKQAEFADLLREASLSGIIGAAKLVADRLKFITGIEALLFDDGLKERLKERSQLHKILADNTWVFGEEFHLSVSDQGLTEVLRKHLKATGQTDVVVDSHVKRVDGTKGVIDLMLTRSIKTNRPDELEHLVVELKAPDVIITQKELAQVESYAFAVAEDERFRNLNVRWDFWIISNDMDSVARKKTRTANLPEGALYQSEDGRITIWVKTWAEVLRANKARLDFIRERLEHQADKGFALRHLQESYDKLIQGTKLDDAIEAAVASADETV